MNRFISDIADNRRASSLATRLRRKRFKLFLELLSAVKKPRIDILDLGGTVLFWENMGLDEIRKHREVSLTILNLMPQEAKYGFIRTVAGDARDLSSFKDGEFDIVFSNSVIEHLGGFKEQRRMAKEAARVGRGYFIQTPNYYFPLEPHFLFPFFQFLPASWRAKLLCSLELSWYGRMNEEDAIRLVAETSLLKLRQLKELFPDALIYRERFFGFTKSFIAYRPAGPGP